MKKLKYILFITLSVVLLNSCLINKESDIDKNDEGLNVVTFERIISNLTVTATGEEFTMQVPVKIVGPTVTDLTNDITVTFSASDASTAVLDDHYRFVSSTLTLKKSNNYLGILEIIMMSEGNAAPMDGTPEFETYVAPVLYLDIAATGDASVTGSGKGGTFTLNFIPPNPYAGLYDDELRYFHPTAGGSYPTDPDFNPDDPYGGIRYSQKELIAVTGRKCETGFAVWPDTDLCWITIDAAGNISFEVGDTWPYAVALGNPYDPSQISHYDEATQTIYLYYNYSGTGGYRIFWEILTRVP